MSDRDGRPSPDALLKTLQQDRRGRLKIFLGAAPGVGKTFEMLTAAHDRLRQGVDVVAGIVETHGRAETEALLAGMPVLPRRHIAYKGRELDEMDLDAILARRPALVLVDELAHTNAPESRHAKRYQDVAELLAAGIDVWSTLNIQHVESLNDVVAQVTRIRVRETVPDSVIDEADEIEVIDLTPDDLIRRLHDGKVYVAKTAQRALGHYFSPGNLTALRELALRRTAQRVDAQLVDHMQAHAIQGPWAAGDRVLVCIDHRPTAAALVRYGKRMAESLRVPWAALHVETARHRALSEAERDRIAEAMRAAERLGAQAVTIPGSDVAADVVGYARQHNFTHIVIGQSAGQHWWQPSVSERLLRTAAGIPVHVLGGTPDEEAKGTARRLPRLPSPTPILGSLAMVALAVAIGLGLRHVLNSSSIGMVFLSAVLVSATTYGLVPSLLACLAATLSYNFFFLEPLYSFTIADPENVVALFFFTLTAIIASNLAARMRDQALAARARARTTEELYQFSRKLAGIANLDDLLWATAYQIAAMLKLRVVLLLPDAPDSERLVVCSAYPPEDALDDADLAAANWAWTANRPTGRGSDTLPGAKRLFLPLRTASRPVAIVGIDSDDARPSLLSPDQRRLLDALGDQAAVSIERMVLAANVEKSRLSAETERLRGALLTSISHDLRTPLSAILGAAGTLQSYRSVLAEADQAQLLDTIACEAERMGRFVANLLDMTRLESGAVARTHEPVELAELTGSLLRRATKILAGHKMVLDVAERLPTLQLDAMLLEQALFNLLDNAAKYGPPGSTITLRAWHDAPERRVMIQVLDEGPGIPLEHLEAIFEKFFRVHSADRSRAGTGLGLAICRGFIEAMGGHIAASNRGDRTGAVFTLSLPAGDAR